ncbi:MAG: tRNA (adenosine(37)-N6)-threonylcarbamoyltransferase complex transferase subunit TsaD [Magnetococcales bacterium]|nr:tRNA (adenosine(37)-N6)-threonylcarbamoyltransferase complex transferase subunit TsaD [Magnetococcales bacterium]
MRVLGVESSCDETAAAVVEGDGTPGGKILLRSNVVHAQVSIHAEYGGVVPELASRAHIQNIHPVVTQALADAGITPQDLDGVAVTCGPGLVGALLVGLSTAKGLAMGLGCPLIGIHHMEGHLMSPFLQTGDEAAMGFPFVALLVSGGHTTLLHAAGFGQYRFLGQTRDDAVGEAFDKGARMLGLGYPGGPQIAGLARGGDVAAVRFPRVLLDKTRFDFSFSGLKTSLRSHVLKDEENLRSEQRRRDVAASYQEAIVDTLIFKALAACRGTGCQQLLVAGGVGANRRLRDKLQVAATKEGVRVSFPPLDLCTDNGAMIATAGLWRLARGERSDRVLNARPRWPVADICS